jgi:hypothetical protein
MHDSTRTHILEYHHKTFPFRETITQFLYNGLIISPPFICPQNPFTISNPEERAGCGCVASPGSHFEAYYSIPLYAQNLLQWLGPV